MKQPVVGNHTPQNGNWDRFKTSNKMKQPVVGNHTPQNGISDRFKTSLKKGFKAGLRTSLWISKMMIPITFGVAILKWLGVIGLLAQWLSPALKLIGLSAEGALIFITSALTSLYSSIALMATLSVDFRMATILAVMGLICHNLIVETVIQRKAGANPYYIVILRVCSALLTAFILNIILPADFTGTIIIERQVAAEPQLGSILYEWLMSMVRLVPMVFGLIIILNCLQQVLREFKLIDYLTVPLKPLMKLFGLAPQSSFLWIVMNTLGLAYGGAILISEYESGEIEPHQAKLLNTHVALSHSLLEDSLIFIAIGIGALWVFVPRIILAFAAVWIERLYHKLSARNTPQRAK